MSTLQQPQLCRSSATADDPNSDGRSSSRHALLRQQQQLLHQFTNSTKGDSVIEPLRRWRRCAIILNTSRRFRHYGGGEGGGASNQGGCAGIPRRDVNTSEASSPGLDRQSLTSLSRMHQLLSIVAHREAHLLADLGGATTLASYLRTSLSSGVNSSSVPNLRLQFGSNRYPTRPPKTFLSFVFDACKDPTLIILTVCALLSLAFGIKSHGLKEGWYDGASILFAVTIVVVVTSVSDFRQSLQFRSLNAEKRNILVHVIRDGRKQKISIFDIVVGDVVALTIGDQVPADGIFIDGHSLQIDESGMTGETEPVHINAESMPFLLAGTKVEDGYGTMLVTAVGTKTEWGMAMAQLDEDVGSITPLQERLNGVATFVGQIGLSVAVAVFIILIAFYFTGRRNGVDDSGKFVAHETSVSTVINNIVDIFAITITIIVVAVPEGLPLAVTLSLAYAMKRMMADRALVRRLSACETMGSATTICTDKTGTLTLNAMTVVKVYIGGRLRDADELTEEVAILMAEKMPTFTGNNVSAIGSNTVIPFAEGENEVLDSYGTEEIGTVGNNLYNILFNGIAQNSAATVFVGADGVAEVMGSATEKAVVVWGLKMGMDFNEQRSLCKILQVETFNSVKKKAGVAIVSADRGATGGVRRTLGRSRARGSRQHSDQVNAYNAQDMVQVHWKGAAEIIVDECDHVLLSYSSDGLITTTAIRKEEVMQTIEAMAAESLRCVAFGYTLVPPEEVPTSSREQLELWKIPEGPLTLLAIVGIKDPCRPGVPQAVRKCQEAGVTVRMVTGDNLATAKAIATECGILSGQCDDLDQGAVAVDGPTFRNYTDDQRREMLPRIRVMARSLPSDKLLMVMTLRNMGEVVAVTGDGTNDAPALHAADVGLSMGIQGTEVAKESSDIIILDDDFSTVVKVLRWGRSIYANIQKFIQFQLTVNVAALTVNFVAAVATGDVPLTAVQLLWVNLIMDTLGALALATEPPTEGYLRRPPVGREEPIVSNAMARNLLLQAVYQVAMLLTLQFRGVELLGLVDSVDEGISKTVIFNAFVFCQLFNEVNAREPEKVNVFKGLRRNRLFLGVLAATVALQIVIVEFLNKFASTVKLTWRMWAVSVAIGLLSWPLAAVAKLLIPVPRQPLFGLSLRGCWGRADFPRHEIPSLGFR